MSRATLNHVVPLLDSRNIADTLRFYVERLGFSVAFRYEADPDNYAGVHRDGIVLHIQWQDALLFYQGRAGQSRIRIAVDDPDALYAEFKERGALPEGVTVQDTPWGTREFGFRDPDGNGLTFFRDE